MYVVGEGVVEHSDLDDGHVVVYFIVVVSLLLQQTTTTSNLYDVRLKALCSSFNAINGDILVIFV